MIREKKMILQAGAASQNNIIKKSPFSAFIESINLGLGIFIL